MKFRRVLLICAFSIFCFACMLPGDSTVKREFLDRNSNAELISSELIFEQDNVTVYLVKYKEKNNQEVLTNAFALKRDNFTWKWCDDHSERKCK